MLLLESGLGLPPWDVLNQGIAEHTPLSFGTANVVVALVVLVVAWALGARIGPGTVANAILIGLIVDGLLAIEAVDDAVGCAARRPDRADGGRHPGRSGSARASTSARGWARGRATR